MRKAKKVFSDVIEDGAVIRLVSYEPVMDEAGAIVGDVEIAAICYRRDRNVVCTKIVVSGPDCIRGVEESYLEQAIRLIEKVKK